MDTHEVLHSSKYLLGRIQSQLFPASHSIQAFSSTNSECRVSDKKRVQYESLLPMSFSTYVVSYIHSLGLLKIGMKETCMDALEIEQESIFSSRF